MQKCNFHFKVAFLQSLTHSQKWCQNNKYDKKIPFVFQRAHTSDAKPLNHFIMDDVVMRLLKRGNPNASLKEILEDETELENYFGTADYGTKVLDTITEDNWDNME